MKRAAIGMNDSGKKASQVDLDKMKDALAPEGSKEYAPAKKLPETGFSVTFILQQQESRRTVCKRMAIRGSAAFLGRGEDNEFSIDDPYISDKHACINVYHGKPCITDLGSTNRTTIVSREGEKILLPGRSCELNEGDSVRIGDVVLEVKEIVSDANCYPAEGLEKGQKRPAEKKADKLGEDASYAIEHRLPVLLELLIKEGADPNARDEKGATLLMRACQSLVKAKGICVVWKITEDGKSRPINDNLLKSLRLVEILLEHGADKDAVDFQGNGLMHYTRNDTLEKLILNSIPIILPADGKLR